jgi:hypothetical protein
VRIHILLGFVSNQDLESFRAEMGFKAGLDICWKWKGLRGLLRGWLGTVFEGGGTEPD